MFLFDEFKKIQESKYLTFEEYLNLGIRLREEGFPEKAIKIHKSLLATPKLKKEDERKIKKELGFDYFEIKDYKNALKYLLEANKLYKGKEKSIKEKLLHAFEKNQLWEDAAELKKSILIEEKKFTEREFSLYLSKIGEILYFQGEQKKAKEFFIKSIKTFSENPIAHFYLGEIERDKEKKIDYYKKALKMDENMRKIIYEKIKEILFEEKEYEYFEKFLEEEENELAKCYLAEYFFQKGEEENSKRILREIDSDSEEVNKKALEVSILLKDISLIEKFSKILKSLRDKDYECKICGYKSKNYRFFCPECEGEFSFIKI